MKRGHGIPLGQLGRRRTQKKISVTAYEMSASMTSIHKGISKLYEEMKTSDTSLESIKSSIGNVTVGLLEESVVIFKTRDSEETEAM